MIIAIDGPSGSGKGTVARLLAKQLDFAVLDTGRLYRLFAYYVLKQGINPSDHTSVISFLTHFNLSFEELNLDILREDWIAKAASIVSQYKEVRMAFLNQQRAFAHHPPSSKKGAILDGRDIGTVVLPTADLKIFITADVEVRAQRRWKELQEHNITCEFDNILKDLKERDQRDMHRVNSPLKAAPDAHIIDTSTLNPLRVTQMVLQLMHTPSI